MSATEPTVLNGVRPDGSYAYTTISDAELGRRLLRGGLGWPATTPPEDGFRGPTYGVDVDELSSSGWGVIFPSGTSGTIREALRPLLELREEQAAPRFQRLELYPEETYESFLRRHGETPGDPNPERIPYYLLLVGGPEEIPFQFQWELDHLYAVGRVHFDGPEDYAVYARAVRDAERGEEAGPNRPYDLTFFGVRNENDSATRRTTDDLVLPLARGIENDSRFWGTARTRTVTGPEATRAELSRLLGGPSTPDVLFTGSHGMVFDPGDPRQLGHQGALLCGDWPGRGHPTAREHYFAAEDLEPESTLPDVTFHFACHGGGTPEWDSFPEPDATERKRLAEKPFTAALPRKLLAHPRGGSRAVIAHVDRAWTTSFDWNLDEWSRERGPQDAPKVFLGALSAILEGRRVGFAMESFGHLYGALTRSFLSRWEAQPLAAAPRGPYEGETPERLARAFRGANDARSFLVFGDPAVRLHRPARRAGY